MQLYPHQKKALEQISDFDRCAVYYDMGLGKTFIGSEKAISFGDDIILVICQKSKVKDWYEHFESQYGFNEIYDLTNKKDFEHFFICIGKYSMIAVINYELAWRRPELARLKNFTLMLDESSLIQNSGAKQTKFIINKLKPSHVVLLSGTPTDGKYERLWTQMHLLGWPISKKLYEQTYVIWDYIENYATGYKIPVVRGYKNVDRLKDKMREYGCIFMKSEEAIELPEQQEVVIRSDAPAVYKRFMKQRYAEVDGYELVGDTSLTMRLYARQICGCFDKKKLAAVKDLIESTSERIIIFYNFNLELAELEAICNDLDRPFSLVNGQIKRLDEYEQYENSVTLVQYRAGAYGLNLQKCRITVYYTLPESSELFEQSKKRTHRIGQSQKCIYYIMVSRNTVEEKIFKTLRERKDYTDALFKEDYKVV